MVTRVLQYRTITRSCDWGCVGTLWSRSEVARLDLNQVQEVDERAGGKTFRA